LIVDKKVKVGTYLNFSFDLQSTGEIKQPLMIDYVIYYQKTNGEYFILKKTTIF